MADQSVNHEDTFTIDLPHIEIPDVQDPTVEELARRQRVVAEILALSEEIGSIGISTDELLHESRNEDDE